MPLLPAVPPVCHALIPAAGIGARAAGDMPKQYRDLCGEPMLAHAVAALAKVVEIDSVTVVLAPGDAWDESPAAHRLASRHGPRVRFEHCGGATRAASVANALARLEFSAPEDWILVHDAARPCLDAEAVRHLIETLADDAIGGLLAVPVADTVKRASADGRVAATVPREDLWLAQTPQMFRKALMQRAYACFPGATDEAGAVEALGLFPRLVRGHFANMKVTYPGDFSLAEAILRARCS